MLFLTPLLYIIGNRCQELAQIFLEFICGNIRPTKFFVVAVSPYVARSYVDAGGPPAILAVRLSQIETLQIP